MTLTVYSFDIFDTCLVRNFAHPADLFFVLAEKVLAQMYPDQLSPEAVFELAQGRVKAETTARQVAGSEREDITLADIYACFEELAGWNIAPETMMRAEICLETESVRPIRAIKDRISRLRQAGERIIFISDMYLPENVLRLMLKEHGLAGLDDRIYLSCEIGLTKQSGRLFQYVLAQEKIKPGQLWHCGDNPYSDVVIPARLGIKTTLFTQSQLNRYEDRVWRNCPADPWACSHMAGVSRAARLMSRDGTETTQLIDIAASVIAPLLTSYVAWVLQDAHRQGLERLYFISRDGEILLKIAQKLARYMPAPQCRYLYGSRQAWFLPTVTRCDRRSLDWLIIEEHAKAPAQLLKKLELAPHEVEETLKRFNLHDRLYTQPSSAELDRFWDFLEQPDVSALILRKAAAARQETLAYFRQEGLYSSTRWALVDTGWALRTQRAVRAILQQGGYAGEVRGYYLAVSKKRLPISEVGSYHAFLVEENKSYRSAGSVGEYLLRNVDLIEHVFTVANHGMVIKYQQNAGEKVLPVLKEFSTSSVQKQQVTRLHETIECYADELGKTGLLEDYTAELKKNALMITKEFLARPQQREVKAIAGFLIGDDQNETRHRKLVRKLDVKDIIYYLARLTHQVNTRDFASSCSWLEGCLALSSFWIRVLFWPIAGIRRFKQNSGGAWLRNCWARLFAREVL